MIERLFLGLAPFKHLLHGLGLMLLWFVLVLMPSSLCKCRLTPLDLTILVGIYLFETLPYVCLALRTRFFWLSGLVSFDIFS